MERGRRVEAKAEVSTGGGRRQATSGMEDLEALFLEVAVKGERLLTLLLVKDAVT